MLKSMDVTFTNSCLHVADNAIWPEASRWVIRSLV